MKSLFLCLVSPDEELKLFERTHPHDPAHPLNRSACQSDFIYEITVKAIKIQDTGKGAKSVDS